MMKDKISRFFGIVVILTTLLFINSCSDDSYFRYPSPIEGTWISEYTDLGPIHPDYSELFSFYSDGYGTFEFIGDLGYPVSIGFTWKVYRGNRLDIYYEDGVIEYYHFRFYQDYLELSTTPHFRTYTGYAPYR